MNTNEHRALLICGGEGIEPDVCYRWKTYHSNHAPHFYDYEILRNTNEQAKDFNYAKLLNAGIRKAKEQGYGIVVKTDIDSLCSTELLAAAYEAVRYGSRAFGSFQRNIPNDDMNFKISRNCGRWHDLIGAYQPTQNLGCFMAMTVDNWYKTWGYPECCTGWGAEDTFLYNRLRKIKLPYVKTTIYPMFHVEHAPRAWAYDRKTSAENNWKLANERQGKWL